MDGVKAKAEVNSSSMRKFLQVVKEAELNQKPAPVTKPVASTPVTPPSSNLTADEMVAVLSGQKTQAQIMADREAKKADTGVKEAESPIPGDGLDPVKVPPIPQLPAQDGEVDGGAKVTTNKDGTRTYSGGMGMFTYDTQGKAIKYSTPNFAGVGRTVDLTNNQTSTNYNQGPLKVDRTHDATGKSLRTKVNYDLGVANMGIDRDDTSGAASTNIYSRDPDLTKKMTAQGINVPYSVKENTGMSRLLSIVTEGRGPLNRPTTAESLTMKHYTAPVLNVSKDATPSMIGKYFKAVEQELKEAAARPNERARQLAERVIERIVPNADGSLPDPSINRLTGKPNSPAAEPAPSNVKSSGATVEYGGETYDVMVFGDKGIRPRIARSDKVVSAKVYTMGSKMFVMLDQGVSEDSDPCWDSHKMVGTKKKGGKTVPNCVPKEAVNPAQQAAIAIAKKKAGKK